MALIHYEKLKGLHGLKFDMKEGQPYEESLINAVFNVYTNAAKKGAIHIHELYFTNFVLGEPGGGTITWHLQKWEKLGGESSSAVYKPCTPTTVKLDEVYYTIYKSKHQEMANKIVRALSTQKTSFAKGGGTATLEMYQEGTDERVALVESAVDAVAQQSDQMQTQIDALQKANEETKASIAQLAEKLSEMPNMVPVANPPMVSEMPTVVPGANLPMAEGPLDPPEEWMVAEAVRVADAQAEAAEAAEAAEVAAAAEVAEAELLAKEAAAVAAAAEAKEAEEAKAAKAAEDKAAESAAKAAKAAEAKAAKSAAKTAKAAEAKAAKSAAKAPVEKPPSQKKVPKKRKPPLQEVSSEEETSERGWSCKHCTYDNGALFSECAMCQEPRDKFHGGLIAKWKKL